MQEIYCAVFLGFSISSIITHKFLSSFKFLKLQFPFLDAIKHASTAHRKCPNAAGNLLGLNMKFGNFKETLTCMFRNGSNDL